MVKLSKVNGEENNETHATVAVCQSLQHLSNYWQIKEKPECISSVAVVDRLVFQLSSTSFPIDSRSDSLLVKTINVPLIMSHGPCCSSWQPSRSFCDTSEDFSHLAVVTQSVNKLLLRWILRQLGNLSNFFKKRLKTHLFTALCETFLPPSASAFLIRALYKFYPCIVLYCFFKTCCFILDTFRRLLGVLNAVMTKDVVVKFSESFLCSDMQL